MLYSKLVISNIDIESSCLTVSSALPCLTSAFSLLSLPFPQDKCLDYVTTGSHSVSKAVEWLRAAMPTSWNAYLRAPVVNWECRPTGLMTGHIAEHGKL